MRRANGLALLLLGLGLLAGGCTKTESKPTVAKTPATLTSSATDDTATKTTSVPAGTMAISEISLRDVVLMAVGEINAKGGVMGKTIVPVVVDPASDWICSTKRPRS
jgi:urea transport system substrate-binding protein